jgi:hypothetical protein
MTIDWPATPLDDIRRLRVLAAAAPGVVYAEQHLEIPFDRVWGFVSDLETSIPALITDVRSFQVGPFDSTADDARFTARAVGLLGNRGAFDVLLRPGWCLMQSRFVIGGMAAVPEGRGTRFAGFGGLRIPGSRVVMKAVGERGVHRVIRRLTSYCG